MNQESPRRLESTQAEQLADLSRQIIETRNQMIKTSNILGNLSSEVRDIGRLQQQQRRGLTLNSVAAYILFVVLVVGGFYFAYRSQIERLDFAKGVLSREHAAAQSKLVSLRKKVEKRRETELAASAFYRLIQVGQIHKALKRYSEVAQLPLSPVESAVFADWVAKNKSRLAYSSYQTGMKAIAEKDYKRSTTAFGQSLSYLPHPPHAASLHFYYGIALMKLGSYPDAAAQLELAISANAEKYVSREVHYHLGVIFQHLDQVKKARSAFKEYIKRHPYTPYARAARRRLKRLE